MDPFLRLTGKAVPLPEADVDTDIIFPARFLLITDKRGLGRYAFFERRFDAGGRPKADFPLNDPAYDGASILVAGESFGVGSSREHAVWSLGDLGLRAVIAPSLGEIFAANCLKNGMAPVALPAAAVETLMADARAGLRLTVDVEALAVIREDGQRFAFSLPAAAREALINGWDEIAQILGAHAAEIAAFESRERALRPWLWATDQQKER